jgi:hypothetical protein
MTTPTKVTESTAAPEFCWVAARQAVDLLGAEGREIAGLCCDVTQAEHNLGWLSLNGEPEEIEQGQAALDKAVRAVWTAALTFSPAPRPPALPETYLGRVTQEPLPELRALRAITGEALVKQGDSNSRGFTTRSSGEYFPLPANVAYGIVGAAPAGPALKFYQKERGGGLVYTWAAPLSREALRLLRLETAAREGVSWHDQDMGAPMHPDVRAVWLAAHTPWAPPQPQ